MNVIINGGVGVAGVAGAGYIGLVVVTVVVFSFFFFFFFFCCVADGGVVVGGAAGVGLDVVDDNACALRVFAFVSVVLVCIVLVLLVWC